MLFYSKLLTLALLIKVVDLQRTTYCVISSLCNSSPVINPRIAPVNGNCPNGYVQCSNPKCGVASAQPGTTNGLATRGAFPWQAFLQNANTASASKKGYAGGGVLIDQYYVLTAAHKIMNLSSVNVIFGLYNSADTDGTQTSKVTSIYYHVDYNSNTLKNDIALLRLQTPINFNNNVNRICSPSSSTSFIGRSSGCVVSGWGQTTFSTDDAPTVTMKQANVPIVSNSVCRSSFSNSNLLGSSVDTYLDSNEICAGGQAGVDACTQDGGSGLVCYDSSRGVLDLAGLVIWGKNCGQANVYGVYVSVPAYANWITSVQSCMSSGSCSSSLALQKIVS